MEFIMVRILKSKVLLVLLVLFSAVQFSYAQSSVKVSSVQRSEYLLETQSADNILNWDSNQRESSESAITELFAPTVTTQSASSITMTGFVMNGSVNPNGVSTQAFFEYGTSSTLSTFNSTGALAITGTSNIGLMSTLSGGVCGTTYYYRMAATPTGGSTSRGSIVAVTTLACVSTPATPTNPSPGSLTSPGPTTSGSNVTLSWSASSGATFYSVAVRDLITNILVVDTTVSGTSYNASLSIGKPYRWNVNACNTTGCSSYTTPLFFQTPTATVPATPTNTNPGSTASPGPTTSGNNVTLSWSASNGATFYSVAVRDIVTNILVVDTTLSGTSYTAGLSIGKPYKWNVNACNTAGCSSYTTPLFFQTPAMALSIVNSAFNPSTATVGIGYAANSAMTATGGQTPYSWSATGFPNGMSINSTSGAPFGTPTVSGTFNVTVTVRDNGSPQQTVSKILTLIVNPGSTLLVPTLSSPADGANYSAGTTSVNLVWNAVAGASTYNLQVGTSCGGTSIANWNQSAASSLVSGLSNGATYFWRVQSLGSGGTSAYSSCRSFSVNNVVGSPPPVPMLSLPSDGTNYPAGTTSAALTWGAVAGAVTYNLQVGTSCGETSIAGWNLSTTSPLVFGLSSGITYFWRVQSVGTGGTSLYSSCRIFSVSSSPTSNQVVPRPLYQTCRPNCGDPNNVAPWGPLPFGPSSNTGGTFNRDGCVMTASTMSLNYILERDYNTNGLNYTPKTLHDILLNGGLDSNGALTRTAINSVRYQTARGDTPFEWVNNTQPNTSAGLSNALANGYPVHVRVLKNPDNGRYEHEVLVTGKEGTRFKIIDPGHPYNNLHFYLDEYGSNFQIRGYVKSKYATNFGGLTQSVSVNSSESASLSVSSDENMHLMLIDPLGRRTGFDPATQQEVNEIPNSLYENVLNLDPFTLDPMNSARPVRSISVTNPLRGIYQVISYGLATGVFNMDVKIIPRIGQLQSSLISVNIEVGATVNSSFDFIPTNTNFDFDNDGKADVAVFRPSTNIWYRLLSGNSGLLQNNFGSAGDIPTPADFDGDGKTDMAIFRPSTGTFWYQSSINNAQMATQWGQAGDIPRPSDFDGDGKADFVLYRPAENNWYRLGSTGQISNKNFGAASDKPVIGDFDGDGKSDVAIYRPSTGTWWYQSSINNAQIATQFGNSVDVPSPADFDGDGKTDFAVFRPTTGVWYILNSRNGTATIIPFGTLEDKPIPADYDGDGKSDIAVFRPSTGIWYLLQSTSGFAGLQFGISSDVPIPNSFVP
jgi:hypothetical protein